MEQSNLKMLVYVVIGALVVVGTLGKLMYNDLFGTSTLVLWAPNDSDVIVSLDGEAPRVIKAGTSAFLEATRGTHKVTSTVGTETFEVSVKLAQGGPRYAIPTSKNQCFALADATRLFTHSTVVAQSKYSKSIRDSIRARVEKRITSHQAEKLPPYTVVGEENLPASRKAGSSVFVVKAFDCQEMQVIDAELLAMMNLD
jgi:hypothetical protein